MEFKTLRYEVSENVGIVTFTRPEKLNTLNMTVWGELMQVLDMIQADDEVCSVLICGEGRAFCAGFDLEDSAEQKEDGMWHQIVEIQKEKEDTRRLWNCSKPIVAAVQGYCLGGGLDFINLLDFVVASTDAKFGEAEMRYSFLPLPDMLYLVGSRRTKEILMLADRFTAAEAKEFGLVNKVVEPEALRDEAFKLARKLAAMPTETMQMTKRILNGAVERMGYTQINDWAWDNFVISKFMPTKLSLQYQEIEKEQGTKAAIHWLNKRFE